MFFELISAHFWGSFMTWGFLMAFMFNVFGKVVGFKDSYSIIITALIVFMSYFSSDHFVELSQTTSVYLEWMTQDILTIATILAVHKIFKIKHHRASYYVYIGLALNGLMFYLMWVDIQVLATQEPWWFWTVYSFGVNTVDYVMIITLIVGRDWLGLVRLGRFIGSKIITKKEKSEVKQKEKRLSQQMLQA